MDFITSLQLLISQECKGIKRKEWGNYLVLYYCPKSSEYRSTDGFMLNWFCTGNENIPTYSELDFLKVENYLANDWEIIE